MIKDNKDGTFSIVRPKIWGDKPVAWIAYDEFGDFMLEATPEGDYPWQPLYTHPAKTLTDEEIGQIWKECMESPYMQVSNPVGFARAILKKAQ